MKTFCPFCKQPKEIEAEHFDRYLECCACKRTFTCSIVATPLIGTMYLDVELTDDFTNPYAEISTIVWWCDQQWHSWVNGQDDPSEFQFFWQYAPQIVTFNGKTFDEPWIIKRFGVHHHSNHIDLMHVARKHGLTGGLKDLGKACGFPRPPELDKVDGDIAIKLWKRFRAEKAEEALQNLLYYNAWDVVLTYYLHCHCLAASPAPIHNAIPFNLNPDHLRTILQKKRQSDAPRKTVGNIEAFWDERKRNPINVIRGAEVCVTGELVRTNKDDVEALIKRLGGTWKNSATRTLDFLVFGDTGEFGQTGKLKKTKENISQGAHTRIIDEDEFWRIVEKTEQETER